MQKFIILLLQNQNQTANNGAIINSVSREQNVKLGLLDRIDWSFPTTEATISVRRNIFLLPGAHQSLSLPLEVFPMFFIWNGIFTSELSGPPQNDHCGSLFLLASSKSLYLSCSAQTGSVLRSKDLRSTTLEDCNVSSRRSKPARRNLHDVWKGSPNLNFAQYRHGRSIQCFW